MPHPQRFTGESIVSWSDLDITISVPWYLGLMFRTRKEDGVLMAATAGTSSKLHLQVSVSASHTGPAEQTGALEITRQDGVSGLPVKGTGCSPPSSCAWPISGQRERGREIWVAQGAVPLCRSGQGKGRVHT